MPDIDVKAELIHETECAYLIRVDDMKDVWLPKSETQYDSEKTFTIPEWLATEKGLV